MKRLILALFALTALVAVPSTAYAAYGVESSDGYGNVSLSSTAALGWKGSATWRANASGKAVYVSGKVIYNKYADNDCGRITGNAYNAFITRSIGCVKTGSPTPASDAAGIKLCRDRSGLPDPCGPERRINY